MKLLLLILKLALGQSLTSVIEQELVYLAPESIWQWFW